MKGRVIEQEDECKRIKDRFNYKSYVGNDEKTGQVIQEPLKQWLSGIELTEDIFCSLCYQLLVLAEKIVNSNINKDSDKSYYSNYGSSNQKQFSLQNIHVIIVKQNMHEQTNNSEDSQLFLSLSLQDKNQFKISKQQIQRDPTNLRNDYCQRKDNQLYNITTRLLHDSQEKRQDIIQQSNFQHGLIKPHSTNINSYISQSVISCLTEILNLKTDTFTSLMRLQMAKMFFQRTFKGIVTNSVQYFVVLLWKLSRDQNEIHIEDLRNILTAVILKEKINQKYEIDRFIKKQVNEEHQQQMKMQRSYFRQYQTRLRVISSQLSSWLDETTSNYLGYVHQFTKTRNFNDISKCNSLEEFCSSSKKQESKGVCSLNSFILSSERSTLDIFEQESAIEPQSHDDLVVDDNKISARHLNSIVCLRNTTLYQEDHNIDYSKLKLTSTSSVYECYSINQIIQLFSKVISQSNNIPLVSHVALQFFAQRKYKLASYFSVQALSLFYQNVSDTIDVNTSKSSSNDDINYLISEVCFALGAIFHSKLEHSKALKCLTAARRFNHRNAAQVLIFYSRRAADKEAVEAYFNETIRQPRRTLPFIPPSFSSKDISEYLYNI